MVEGTVVIIVVVLAVWAVVLTVVLTSMSCCGGQRGGDERCEPRSRRTKRQIRRREMPLAFPRRRASMAATFSSSSSSSSDNDDDPPPLCRGSCVTSSFARPAADSGSVGSVVTVAAAAEAPLPPQDDGRKTDPQPRDVVNNVWPDVCGVSSDPRAVALYNNHNDPSTKPFVTQIFGPIMASALPVPALLNPNYVPAVFSGSYNRVLSVSQRMAGASPPVAAGGSLNVIQLASQASSTVQANVPLDAAISSFLPSLVSVASNVNKTGHNQAFIATTDGCNTEIVIFKEEVAGQGGYQQLQSSLSVRGMVQDMRVSPDGASLVVVTDAVLPHANVYIYDIFPNQLPVLVADVSTQSARYDGGSPPEANDLVAVSAAFTPDNVDILLALTNGTGPDRVLRISNTDATFQGVAYSSIPTTGVPRQVAVKIIASGEDFIVGRRGTDLVDVASWLSFPSTTSSFSLGGNNSGTVDLQNAPVVGPHDSYVVVFNNGQNALVVNDAATPQLHTTVLFLTPVTRISFFKDGQKCYFGTNSNTPTVYEQDMFQPSTAPYPIRGTETNTWYLTATSSADASSSFSDED